ncbi:hypothetical protein ABIB50_002466 [Mucilaginibacter sp. UYCu711]
MVKRLFAFMRLFLIVLSDYQKRIAHLNLDVTYAVSLYTIYAIDSKGG